MNRPHPLSPPVSPKPKDAQEQREPTLAEKFRAHAEALRALAHAMKES